MCINETHKTGFGYKDRSLTTIIIDFENTLNDETLWTWKKYDISNHHIQEAILDAPSTPPEWS